MKVLFAIRDEDKIIDSLLRKYQQDSKREFIFKKVSNFTAIIKELQKNNDYDRIIIGDDVDKKIEQSENKDKLILKRLKDIVTITNGVPIIYISRTKKIVNELFELKIYNALIGKDRTKKNIYELIRKPRTKKSAIEYYKIETRNDKKVVNKADTKKSSKIIESQKQAKNVEPKRGRGRPRKESNVDKEQEVTETIKRGRGRPRKDIQQNQTENTNKVKKVLKDEINKESKNKKDNINNKEKNQSKENNKKQPKQNIPNKNISSKIEKKESKNSNVKNKNNSSSNSAQNTSQDADEYKILNNKKIAKNKKDKLKEDKLYQEDIDDQNLEINNIDYDNFDEFQEEDYDIDEISTEENELEFNNENKEDFNSYENELDDDFFDFDEEDLDLDEDDLDIDDEDLYGEDFDEEDIYEDDLDTEEDLEEEDFDEEDIYEDDLDIEDEDLEEEDFDEEDIYEDDLDIEDEDLDEEDFDEEDIYEDDLDIEDEDLDEEDFDEEDIYENDVDIDDEELDEENFDEEDIYEDDLDIEDEDLDEEDFDKDEIYEDDLDIEDEELNKDNLDIEDAELEEDDINLEEFDIDEDDLDQYEFNLDDDELLNENLDEEDFSIEENDEQYNDDLYSNIEGSDLLDLDEEPQEDDDLLDLDEEDDDILLDLDEEDENDTLINLDDENYQEETDDLIGQDEEENNEDLLNLDNSEEEFSGIKNKNYNPNYDISKQISEINDNASNEEDKITNKNYNIKIRSDQKVIAFVGSRGSGTSFIINNLAQILSMSQGIKTAILDLTKNKNSYYIYTENEDKLRSIAFSCFEKLGNGSSEGIKVNKNLTVYTSLPNDDDNIENKEKAINTILKEHSIVLLDCDFETDLEYFKISQEIYLVQSLDILTIQPLTSFLKKLKINKAFNEDQIKILINKDIRVTTITDRMLISAMSVYNSPDTTYQLDLFNRHKIEYLAIPFEEKNYSKYLDELVKCKLSIRGYSKNLLNSFNKLVRMVYPVNGSKKNKAKYNNYNG